MTVMMICRVKWIRDQVLQFQGNRATAGHEGRMSFPQTVVSGCWRLMAVGGKIISKAPDTQAYKPASVPLKTPCPNGKVCISNMLAKTSKWSFWVLAYCCSLSLNESHRLVCWHYQPLYSENTNHKCRPEAKPAPPARLCYSRVA